MKVFLVEDAPNVRELLRFAIRDAGGILVGEATTQSQAVTLLRITNPDVAVIDLRLADGNGIGVIREIRLTHPELKVIVLTNQDRTQLERICLESGADYFFEKTGRDYQRFEEKLRELSDVYV